MANKCNWKTVESKGSAVSTKLKAPVIKAVWMDLRHDCVGDISKYSYQSMILSSDMYSVRMQ